MKWKSLGGGQYEALTARFHFYVTRAGRAWVLDIFDATIANDDDAHMDALDFATRKAAMAEAELREADP